MPRPPDAGEPTDDTRDSDRSESDAAPPCAPPKGPRGEVETSAWLRAILDTAICAIVTIDETGAIESANPACRRLFGYEPEDLLGRNISLLMAPPLREEHNAYLQRYLRTGETHIVGIGREVEGIRKDGTRIPLLLAVNEFRVGDRLLFTGMLHDMSDAARARAELQVRVRQQEIVAALGMRGLAGGDPRDLIEDAVSLVAETLEVEFCQVLELQPEGRFLMAAGVGWADGVIGSETVGGDDDSQAGYALRHGKPVIVEDLATERRFRPPRLLVEHGIVSGLSVVILGAKRPYGVFGAHTRSHRTFKADDVNFVQSVANVIAETVQQHETRKRLLEQESLVQLGEMAAVVAHEVKNTQAGVSGGLRVIAERLAGDSETHGVIEEMLRRLESLNGFMGDVLTFARPRRPRSSPVPIQLLLEDTATITERHPDCTGIIVDLDGVDLLVSCDVEMIRSVFVNLLVNAAQAVDGRGRVRVRVEAARDLGGQDCCRVSIADDGPGIPPEQREKVFQPFYSTKHRGSGLGLAIARRVVELHGGTVSIENRPHGGTRVTILLPTEA